MSAQHDGRDLPLGPPRRRALLCLLLVRLGRVVPTEMLIQELWGDKPPRQAVATLQSHISHLRRALDLETGQGKPSVLRYRAPGYALHLRPENVDVHRFEQLVRKGRKLLHEREPGAAHARLGEALELWRGSPYTEFAAHQPLADERTRLEQSRLTAMEFHAEAGLAIGAADEVMVALSAEVRRHPTRERLVGHLMTALARLGRQGEALELYERTRSHLVQEFGVDAAVELQRVHTAILRQEPGVGGPADEPSDRPDRPDRSDRPDRPDGTVTTPAAEPYPPVPLAPLPFIGREQELHRLMNAVSGAGAGRGHIASVIGPAGIGKTRLLMELGARIEGKGESPEVITSQCLPFEGVSPYWMWTQILRRLSATRPDSFLSASAPFSAQLAPLLPGQPAGPEAVSEADWAQARFRTYDAVGEVLLTLAVQHPIVLFVEDLHWADAASLDLLRLLCARCQGYPLSIVMTARNWGTASDDPVGRILTEILRSPRAETVKLGGLPLDAIGALAEAQAESTVDAETIRLLHQRSGGNPYFVLQFLSLLRKPHDARTTGILLSKVPSGVREVMNQQLSALPETVLRALRLCAVIGAEVDIDLLYQTTPENEQMTEALETAVGLDLLREDPLNPGRLHFTHALVQETLVGEMSHDERSKVHAKAARELSARSHHWAEAQEDEGIERVAHHVWHGRDAVPSRWALPLLVRAIDQAERRRAYEQMEVWLRRAAHVVSFLTPHDIAAQSLERRLYLQLGRLLGVVRGYGDAEAEVALRRGRAPRATAQWSKDPAMLISMCMTHLTTGRYRESLQFSGLLRILAARTRHPTAMLGTAYGEGLVLFVSGRLPEALTTLERGIEAADLVARESEKWEWRPRNDPRITLRCHETFPRWLLGDRAGATERRLELLRMTESGMGSHDRAFALYVDAVVAALEGDVATAQASGAEGSRLAGKHRLPHWQAMLGVPQGWALAHSGHENEGVPLMLKSLAELRRSRTRFWLPLHLGLLGQAQYHAGQQEEATATLRKMARTIERRKDRVYLNSALPATRLLHKLLGHNGAETMRQR
ncbi:BTAD domain-containing putative transcriptional regulator [Streptomyces sp. NPDC005962]|uniref:ATP-binding protein n=1 Tax=Streptomyces sp. NPDC005962 TaxID=3154466 RepID=UPI0033C87B7A